MPPRRKNKEAPNIKSDFLASLPKDLASTSSHAILSPEQLLRAYGLAPPRPTASEGELLNRTCRNLWNATLPENNGKTGEELATVDDSDDDIIFVAPALPKTLDKGKGKAKDSCSHEKCHLNPRCLNWLGQDKWENTESLMKIVRRNAGLGVDPTNIRDVEVPVGLKNLGATCYANSFLQVWFQDETFRAGVYACALPANGDVDKSPLYQLQVLFAFLQTSKQGVYNPETLITALKLDKGEQQDSQEFSKLFLSLLDSEFKKQGARAENEGLLDPKAPKIATLVEDQFEGQIAYGIECDTCHSSSERHSAYLELEVNLKKDCKLEDRLKESLMSEQMTGDNQYLCDHCKVLRDATRSTQLQTIPPVLHISLLRFVFSMEEMSRSKSRDSISYPLKLDMGKFLPRLANGQQPEVWYELTGVLMHKGASAHHGHYVAQVLNASSKKWFLFDDETVTPIDDLNAPGRYDEEEPAKTKKLKPNPGFTRTASGDLMPKSRDAYMLIYTRSAVPSQTSPKHQTPVPAPLAAFQVTELDQAHDLASKLFQESELAAKESFEKLRDEKRSVYRVWDVLEDDEDAYLLDKTALKDWLLSDLPTNNAKLKVGKENGAVDEKEDDVMIVEHVAAVQDVEMSEAASSREASISPTVKSDDLNTASSEQDIEKSPAKPRIISSESIICPHGLANPLNATDMKRISQLGLMALADVGVQVGSGLVVRSSLCRECVWMIACQDMYLQIHADQVQKMREIDFGGLYEEDSVWISKYWLNDWRKDVPAMHRYDTQDDPAPDSEPWINHILCEHQKLQPNLKLRQQLSPDCAAILQSIFPDWSPISSELMPCVKCAEKSDDAKAEEAKEKVQITKEKLILRSFDNQSKLIGKLSSLSPDVDYFIIPRPFISSWVRWTRGKAPRPADVDNSTFFCKHGKITIDFDKELISPLEVEIVAQKQWKLLQTEYDANPKIRLQIQGRQAFSDPQVCDPCLAEKRKDFETTEIKIRFLSSHDFDEKGEIKKDRILLPEAPVHQAGSIRTYGQSRQSSRIASKPHLMAFKATRPLEMLKKDTVKDLKIKCSVSFDIPTIYQRIFYLGRELDNDETVEALELCSGSILELYEVKVSDPLDLTELDDSIPDSLKKSSKKRQLEEGFSGTGLLNWDGERAVGKGSDSPSIPVVPVMADSKLQEEVRVVSCCTCTFIQTSVPAGKVCEVCDSEL